MESKPKLKAQSGLLIRPFTIALLITGGAAAAYFGYDKISLFLVAAGFMAIAVRIWAKLSVKKLSISVKAESPAVFPGQDLTISYKIHNRKLLPLVWLELIHPLEDPLTLVPDNRDELRPLNELELSEFTPPSRDDIRTGPPTRTMADEKRFSMIMWYQSIVFDTLWHAEHRGIFRLDETRAVTGDGLGLSQLEWPVTLENTETVTVYPKPLPVNIDLFMKNLYQTQNSAAGTYEDITVIKNTRDYQSSDPAKYINWRLTAKGMPLQLNLFETVLPQMTLLIFDTESFNGETPDTEGLEETISLLTGAVLELSRKGISFSMSMPQTEELTRAVLHEPAEMLYYLAAYRFRPLAFHEDEGKRNLYARPSHFSLQETLLEAEHASQVFYICRDESALSNRIFSRLESPVALLRNMPEKADTSTRILPLSVLKGGAGNG